MKMINDLKRQAQKNILTLMQLSNEHPLLTKIIILSTLAMSADALSSLGSDYNSDGSGFDTYTGSCCAMANVFFFSSPTSRSHDSMRDSIHSTWHL